MAPIRRYLRISKYSVLECRIFLENPADGPRWLLNSHNPALPRVIEAVKPYVLPKLREENERAKGKGKKKKSVKDVVQQDDFEVSIFLTEIGTRHSLLVKSKAFRERKSITSNASRLNEGDDEPVVIHEDGDGDLALADIPSVDGSDDEAATTRASRDLGVEDDKKLGFRTTYEGFSIWGWVLCLLVERKGGSSRKPDNSQGNAQALMQEWIASTQQDHDDT